MIARHRINPPDEAALSNAKFIRYRSKMSMDKITNAVVDETDIPRSLIVSDNRKRTIVEKRQIIMYLARQHRLGTVEEIAGYFGKDHSTAIHACKVIQNLIDTDKEFENLVNRIKRRLS